MVMTNLTSFVVSVCLASITWNVVSANSCQSISDRMGSHDNVYRHNGICYAFMNTELKWVEAEKSCKDMGADMVRIPDETTMQFLKTVMNDELKWSNNGVWIGLHNRNNDGWKWTTGDEQTYRYWIVGAPTKTFGLVSLENCAVMRRTSDWRWGDYFCNNRFYKYKYICQFHMPTSPTSPITGSSQPPTTETIPTITPPSTQTSTYATTTGTTTPDPALCNKFQFRCTNGQCLSRDTRCNGIYDCLDFSDEHHCSVCTGSTIKCNNTNRCIYPSWVCDGADDCGDNSDEENCDMPSTVATSTFRSTRAKTSPTSSNTGSTPPPTTETIPTITPPSTQTSTYTTTTGECFECRNSDKCVDMRWVCDGANDCGDNSDEENCGEITCKPTDFQCLSKHCIPEDWKCDGEQDCLDGSDESPDICTDTSTPTATTTTSTPEICQQFKCENLKCIDLSYTCNHVDDCGDYSDEVFCEYSTTTPSPALCNKFQFRCTNGQCLSRDTRCNGIYDCLDFSDEHHCSVCTGSTIKCKNTNRCIHPSWVCDGTDDCGDNSDEKNCDTSSPTTTTVTTAPEICQQFECENLKCINFSYTCNHVDDCGDYSDEVFCDLSTTPDPALCNKFQFRCTNGQCLSRDTRCNGIYDCFDFSDEHHCSVCTGSTIKCKNTNRCINPSWVCDGSDDCGDNSDEENCDFACSNDKFQCTNKKCIPAKWQCDGEFDCSDESDEVNCTSTKCKETEFTCTDNSCIPLRWKCDFDKDCSDGSDEFYCSTPSMPPTDIGTRSTRTTTASAAVTASTTSPYCKDNEFRCFDGACIDTSWQCDGYSDCVDHSDEDNCKQCGASEWSCLNGKQCIFIHWKCDGEDDCIDGSDEYNCNSTTNIPPIMTTTTIPTTIKLFSTPSISSTTESPYCKDNQFRCVDGACIEKSWQCDGYGDCVDHSDEDNCKQCGDSEWSCLNGRQCILQHWKCDGEDDCLDGTDEYNCNSTTNIPTKMTTTTIPTTISLFSTPSISSTTESACFKCNSTGVCIRTEWVCDGDQDCDDNSDENNCDYYDLLQEILDEKNRIRQLLRMSKDELLEFIQGSKEAVDLSMVGVLATGTKEDALVSALMSLFAKIYVV